MNHGNFLELICLLSEYDSTLHNHLTEVIKQSKIKRDCKLKGSSAKGKIISIYSLLSKTTINHVIDMILEIMKGMITGEVNGEI